MGDTTNRRKYLDEQIERASSGPSTADHANASVQERDNAQPEATGVGEDNTEANESALARQYRAKIEAARRAGNTAMVEKFQRKLAALEND